MPFGYLGALLQMTALVLACTPEGGGKLMHTPKYTVENNLKNRKANFVITPAGDLEGTMSTTFKGTDYENASYLADETRSEQYKWIKKNYPINNMDIEHLELKHVLKVFANPMASENIKLHARDYALR